MSEQKDAVIISIDITEGAVKGGDIPEPKRPLPTEFVPVPQKTPVIPTLPIPVPAGTTTTSNE